MSDLSYYANGIDRKSNQKGYTPQNCVPCCEICNKAKRNMNYVKFMGWIELLVENLNGV